MLCSFGALQKLRAANAATNGENATSFEGHRHSRRAQRSQKAPGSQLPSCMRASRTNHFGGSLSGLSLRAVLKP